MRYVYIEQSASALAFITATPALQSCLYDLDMLPEQLKRGSKEWDRMLIITHHFREAMISSNRAALEADARRKDEALVSKETINDIILEFEENAEATRSSNTSGDGTWSDDPIDQHCKARYEWMLETVEELRAVLSEDQQGQG